jgi:para-aminobenzoate synthetase/4-amino-4-deoxychorismate lyase
VSEGLRCRFDHREGGISQAFELAAPVGQLEARTPSEVVAVLDAAEAAAARGLYAAGFVAYEAAPAFDRALAVRQHPAAHSAAHLPLAWFGLFAESHPAAPLPLADLPAAALDGESGRPRRAGDAPWIGEIDAAEHAGAVEAIRSAIAAGDTYLVNYTTRFRRRWTADDAPFALYQRLVAGYASGFHAYLETPEWAVACGSPELFFELVSNRLTTRPMKGTGRRGRWSAEDLRLGAELGSSAKERAENVMVVDLLRNDLGRIAVPGTVVVPELWQVERHPTLWQLTSTVTAATTSATGLADVFGALFPCGSVTGAPKVSAMSTIAHLERSERGVYCGAVGLVQPASASPSGPPSTSARFAVAIRTAVVDKARQMVEYGSGGGITWDSTPEAEWEEVLLKAKALTDPAVPARPPAGLLETMSYHPSTGGDTGSKVRNLPEHLVRLASSAAYLGFPAPHRAGARVAESVAGLSAPARVRMVLHADGRLEVDATPLPDEVAPARHLRLCIDAEPVFSSDATLFHKTTDRDRYSQRALRHPHADDVVLINERHEVTETTRANLAVRLAGRWWTPALDCGLLPGVERGRLLDSGVLAERVVTVDDLCRAEAVATLSSLRGWRAAQLLPACST